MLAGEYVKLLEKSAKDYVKDGAKSVKRNMHMNNLIGDEEITQDVLEAIIVDFINFLAYHEFHLDLGLYTKYIQEQSKNINKNKGI